MKRIFSILMLILTIYSNAQIQINFEDLNLSNWQQSNLNHWAISDYLPLEGFYSLKHIYDSPISDNDAITISLNHSFRNCAISWKFKLRYDYYPSSTNHFGIALTIDKDAQYLNPDSSFSGYILGVNLFGSSTDDSLRFYVYSNGNLSKSITLNLDWENDINPDSTVNFVINRTAHGFWQIFIANGNYAPIKLIGEFFENSFDSLMHFGIYYAYSSTQDRKLWFDDLKISISNPNKTNKLLLTRIDSVINSTTITPQGQQLLKLQLIDDPNDNLNTKIDAITLFSNQNINNVLSGTILQTPTQNFYGKIGENAIIYPVDINIPNGDTITINIYFWNQKNPAVQDNFAFNLSIDSLSITVKDSSSQFYSQTISYNFYYSVKATTLKLLHNDGVIIDSTFSVLVYATDQYENLDLDINQTINLFLYQGTGNISIADNNSLNMQNGFAKVKLKYNKIETFKIGFYVAGIFNYTQNINCSNFLSYVNEDFEDQKHQYQKANNWSITSDALNGLYSLAHNYIDNSNTEFIYRPLIDFSADSTLEFLLTINYNNSNPSSTNNWAFILFADTNELNTLNGYALGLNYNVPDDTIKLYLLLNGTAVEILRTNILWDSKLASKKVKFKVERNQSGFWKLWMDTSGIYQFIDSVLDTTIITGKYTGFKFSYSSTYSSKIKIDDIYIGWKIPDTIPPKLDTIYIKTANQILVSFNEPIKMPNSSQISVQNHTLDTILPYAPNQFIIQLQQQLQEGTHKITIFNIQDLAGNTTDSIVDFIVWIDLKIVRTRAFDPKTFIIEFNKNLLPSSSSYIHLTPTNDIYDIYIYTNKLIVKAYSDFINGQIYTFTIDSIYDYQQKLYLNLSSEFRFYLPQSFDIIFNEIMPDISPEPPALAPAKYIEIYNRQNFPIDITNWSITINDRYSDTLKNSILPPKTYAIICMPQDTQFFQNFTQYVFPLNNIEKLTTTEGKIVLKAHNNQLIDQLNYSKDMYSSSKYADGGYALERIDQNFFCNQMINWQESKNPIGGTPGWQNSITKTVIDTTPPKLIYFELLDNQTVALHFSENINLSSNLNISNFRILNIGQTVLKAYIDPNDYKTLIIVHPAYFDPGENKILIQNISDFCQNIMPDTVISIYNDGLKLTSFDFITPTQLELTFSMPLSAYKLLPEKFKLLNTNISVKFLLLNNSDPKNLYLFLSDSLEYNTIYQIAIDTIYSQNLFYTLIDTITIIRYTPKIGDIQFSEFMIDVNPQPPQIPPFKYLEIHNTTNIPIPLNNFSIITPNQKIYQLPKLIIEPNNFLVITQTNSTQQLGLTIINDDDFKEGPYKLMYKNTLIDFAYIQKSMWNTHPDGGYALEKINFTYKVYNPSLWIETSNPTGGTPGTQNSIDSTINLVHLKLDSIKIIASKTINLYFNHGLIDSTPLTTNSFYINNLHPNSIYTDHTSLIQVKLITPLKPGSNYLKIDFNYLFQNSSLQFSLDTNIYYNKLSVTQLIPIDSATLLISFNQPLNDSLTSLNNFLFNDYNPTQISKSSTNQSTYFLIFPSNILTTQNELLISDIYDLDLGYKLDTLISFEYYYPNAQEILITEILPDPYADCPKFLEIYNASNKTFYLKDLRLANIQNNLPYNIKNIAINLQDSLKPYSYLAITTDTSKLKQCYQYTGNLYQANLPSITADGGTIAVLNTQLTPLDILTYDDNMHSKLLANTEGVSLERISIDKPSTSDNWTSASATVGFATPGLPNSQSANNSVLQNIKISVFPNIVTETTQIIKIFVFNAPPDTYCNLEIYSIYGNHLGTITKATLLSTSLNQFEFNVRNLTIGYYIIAAKLYDTKGNYALKHYLLFVNK